MVGRLSFGMLKDKDLQMELFNLTPITIIARFRIEDMVNLL